MYRSVYYNSSRPSRGAVSRAILFGCSRGVFLLSEHFGVTYTLAVARVPLLLSCFFFQLYASVLIARDAYLGVLVQSAI